MNFTVKTKKYYDRNYVASKIQKGDLVIYEELYYSNIRELAQFFNGFYQILNKICNLHVNINSQIQNRNIEIVHFSNSRHYYCKDHLRLSHEQS